MKAETQRADGCPTAQTDPSTGNGGFKCSRILSRAGILLLHLLALFAPVTGIAQEQQPQQITPGGIFDEVSDRFGNKYNLSDLRIQRSAGHKSGAPPNVMCTAGMFDVYFEPNSGMAGNSMTETDRRNLVCQVMQDISDFLDGANWNSSTRVNIQVDDIAAYVQNPGSSGVLGLASAFYCYPKDPGTNYPGMIYNTVQKTILSKVDAYQNVVNYPMTGAGGFYHGFMAFNFVNTNYNWFTNYSTGLAGTSQLDLYSVVLHEMTHQLGFASLINATGLSNVGNGTYNYYGKFDTYLTDSNNSPLLLSGSNCSSQYDLQFNAIPTALAPACTPGYPWNTTTCGTSVLYASASFGPINIYTPDCFEGGSSLSHFEDMCYPTPNPTMNDQIFTMSNANGNGVNKRYLQEEERSVLCDIGYTVLDYYATPAFGVTPGHQYTAPQCNSNDIWGVNDGIGVNGYMYMSACGAITIPTAALITNDSPNAVNIKCVESVYNNGTAAIVSTNIIFTPAAGYLGGVLIRYIPIDASGNEGNITYVYAYVQVCQCNTHCDLVQNGGFENGMGCGVMRDEYNPVHRGADCWMTHTMTPDYYVRGCTAQQNSTSSDLGTNTNGSNPIFDSHTGPGTGNDKIVGLTGYFCGNGQMTALAEEIFTKLRTPLVSGKTYKLSFWAYQYAGQRYDPALGLTTLWTENALSVPVKLKFRSSAIASVFNTGVTGNPVPTFASLVNPNLGSTFNTWIPYTFTFLYNPSSPNNDYLYVAIDITGTAQNYIALYGASTQCERFQVLIDDISLQEVVFTPPTSFCQGTGLSNLAQYAIVAGTFSGPGVTFSGGQYHFNQQGSMAAGTYPVSFTFSGPGGCQMVQIVNITLIPIPVITLAPNAVLCSSNGPPVIAVNVNPPTSSVSWNPGGSGTTLNLPLNTTGTYIGTAVFNGCSSQITVNVKLHCCNTLVPYPQNTIMGGSTLAGPMYFNQNVTITGGSGITNWVGGEFIFAPNVQVTVQNGQHLSIQNAHVFACDDMWTGIDVADGGKISVNNSLVEDAMQAIRLNGATTNHAPLPVDIINSIFNRNDVSVYIGNTTLNFLQLRIESSVFTCRGIQYTPTSWPNVPMMTTIANPPTGLASPYSLGWFPLVNLTGPMTTVFSRAGIVIDNFDNVNGNSPGIGVEFGNNINPNDFNLFDGMKYGIDISNGSMKTMNNVFTDMRQVGPIGGTGVNHVVTSDMNASLELSAFPQNNISFGNRFWNCYTGVDALKVYKIRSEYSVFRSTQNKTSPPGIYPGNMGMRISTNRFNYDININDFNNVKDAINITITGGSYNTGVSQQFGTYANNMNIKENYIDAHVSGMNPIPSEYVSEGISLVNSSGAWNAVGSTGIFIHSNNVNRAFRGISVDAVQNYLTEIDGNKVKLANDVDPTLFQYGIQLKNTVNNISVKFNDLEGTVPFNPRMTLVYCDNNSASSGSSPVVLCNILSNCNFGFDFNGSNASTMWRGNDMNNHNAGLVLSNFGIIGPQFSMLQRSSNRWLWTSPGLHTLVRGNSNAALSILYVQSGFPWQPTLNGGTPPINSYATTGNVMIATDGLNYTCPPNSLPPPPVHRHGNTNTAFALESLAEEGPFEIYPNPASDRFIVSGIPAGAVYDIMILDAAGKTVYIERSRTGSKSEVNIRLANGLYLVKVVTVDGVRMSRKLVITE
jgi:hypothetical protein